MPYAKQPLTNPHQDPMLNNSSMFWPQRRQQEIEEKLHALGGGEEIRFAFLPSPETEFLRYLPEDLSKEIADWAPDTCRLIDPASSDETPDIVLATTHVSDREPTWLWTLRERYGPHPLLGIWMWDNHFDHETNLKAAQVADLVFPSHHYDATYLTSPNALLSNHIAACSAQWTRSEAEQLFDRYGRLPRKHALLVNYAKYDFAEERNTLIDLLGAHIPEADMLLMSQADRSRYFSKSRDARFAEWAAYKTTVIIPMIADLSTRFFDAMLAGLVPIVPSSVKDLDLLLSPQDQATLGIVRLPSYSLEDVSAAVKSALTLYDEGGIDGAIARHRYVLENHMVINRVTSMLYSAYLHATGQLGIELKTAPWGPGLYTVPGPGQAPHEA